MSKSIPIALALVLTLVTGCGSTSELTLATSGQPAASVSAVVSAGAGGQQVLLDDPAGLPPALRDAAKLEVALGAVKVPVARSATGVLSFAVPANVKLDQDVSGAIRAVFVVNDTQTWLLTLRTGGEVRFAAAPILTAPAPALVTRGFPVTLTAATDVAEATHQFTWAYGPSGTGPWQAIPETGKAIAWEPPTPGNHWIKLDTLDRRTGRTQSTVSTGALVFVRETDNLVTTQPAGGAVREGEALTLSFNPPPELAGREVRLAWSAGLSPQGPWTPIDGSGPNVSFEPADAGSYFVRVEAADPTGTIRSFTTASAVVFVSEGPDRVSVSASTAERGDAVTVSLAGAVTGQGPYAWSYTRLSGGAPGPTSAWTRMPGQTASVPFIATDIGAYAFRVELPDPDGGFDTHQTDTAVLNVSETQPIIQSDPPFNVVSPGSSVSLVFGARGIIEADYQFTWFTSPGPQGPWTLIPLDEVRDMYSKRREWETQEARVVPGFGTVPGTAPGQYYVRVQANRRDGTASYTFTSDAPVVTVFER